MDFYEPKPVGMEIAIQLMDWIKFITDFD